MVAVVVTVVMVELLQAVLCKVAVLLQLHIHSTAVLFPNRHDVLCAVVTSMPLLTVTTVNNCGFHMCPPPLAQA